MNTVQELNPQQKEAVETVGGPLLILAGPGSGKTRVVTQRIAHLIINCGVQPYRILAVTFTNKAAREMGDRIHELIGRSADDITLGTFHAICSRILRKERGQIGLDSNFVIYDSTDQINLLKRDIQAAGLDTRRFHPRAIQSAISSAKSQLITPSEYNQYVHSYFEEVASRIYELYQKHLTQNNALDFDDLIMEVVLLFRKQPELLSKYQQRYLHINIDEFQDTNLAQYALVKQLADKYRNICVVGDPDQSIYSWRSADLRNILNFENDYPEAKLIMLEQNYRSTKTILGAAQQIISGNLQRKEKDLWTENEEGAPIITRKLYSEQEEAQFIVSEVERLISQGDISAKNCAVMYRTNAQSRTIEEMFVRYGIAYQLIGGTRFYERQEVKDILAYLKLIYNPLDEVSLNRIINIPKRGIGKQTINQLSQWARSLDISLHEALRLIAQPETGTASPFTYRTTHTLTAFFTLLNGLIIKAGEMTIPTLLDTVLTETNYREYILSQDGGEERWDNILELHTVATQYQDIVPPDGLALFLERTTLVSDTDALDEKPDAVTLITLHQTKGLEFPIVFITGMEEGIFPHIRSFDDPSQMEEERRLCYVGVTRAKKQLYLLHTLHRHLSGRSTTNPPSRFLRDISKHLITPPSSEEKTIPTKTRPIQPTAVPKTGSHIHHMMFGDGIVINCVSTTDDYEITAAFGNGFGIKKLLLSLAPIEITGEMTTPPLTDSSN
ncbi:MAG: UvrD-helicase domain-containing protein [Dehalococcoidia bacterium]|nr:UvrD-helicase domain-containing protein [Dehalococcoidia bacterium]